MRAPHWEVRGSRFNSRSREGSDGIEIQRLMEIDVSIHAPARGATLYSQYIKQTTSFNSRSREGSDCWVVGKLPVPSEFQFTLPRGERRLSLQSM